jgi:hypothetical protein
MSVPDAAPRQGGFSVSNFHPGPIPEIWLKLFRGEGGRWRGRGWPVCRPGGGTKYCAAVTGILTALSALGGLVLTVVVIMAED